MKAIWSLAILLGFSTAAFAQDEKAEPTVKPEETEKEAVLVDGEKFKIYWKNGTHVESADGKFKLKFGGRLHNDWAFISADDDVKDAGFAGENGTEFRRARLFLSGTLWDRVIFKAQYDFAGGDADFKDAYLGVKGLPFVGTITVGQQFEPFGFNVPNSNYYTFMEGGLDSSISPQRSTGIKLHNQAFEDQIQWSLGYFWGDTDSFGDARDSDGLNVFTGRVSGLALYEEGEMLLHFGLSISNRHLRGKATDFESKPMSNLAEDYVETTTNPEDLILFGFEVGFAYDSLHAQLEFVLWEVDPASGAEETTNSAWYIQIGCFLTGEVRPYSKKKGQWSRVTPLKNAFGEDGGYGAWELKVRFQMVDGNNEVSGNEMINFAFGANWHLNSAARVMLEYVFSDLEIDSDEIGKTNILQMRFQIDF